jgi:iron(III) transport system permease protein
MDPSLEEASSVSGAGGLTTFFRINFPLTLPAMVAAALYLFITAIEVFEVPGLIGAPARIFVFSTLIYYATHPEVGLPRYGLAGAYGMIVLALAFVGSYLYYRVIRHGHKYEVITGKGYRPKLLELGRLKILALLFLLFYFTLEIFLPFITLVWASLVPYIQVPSAEAFTKITLANYLKIPDYSGWKPFVNTGLLMLSAPTISMFFSVIFSWVVIRSRIKGRYLLDGVAFLPHAVPSIVFAVALSYLALAYREYFPVYGTLIIIILANAIKYISFGTRTVNGALIQIHRELEEAAEVSGASKVRVLSSIITPLLGPALFNGWLWISLLAFREVTMALTLISPKNVMLSTLVWNLWSAGYVPEAAALGVMLVFVLASFVVLARKLGEKAVAAL